MRMAMIFTTSRRGGAMCSARHHRFGAADDGYGADDVDAARHANKGQIFPPLAMPMRDAAYLAKVPRMAASSMMP